MSADDLRREGLEDLDALFRAYLMDPDAGADTDERGPFLDFLRQILSDEDGHARLLALSYNAMWALHSALQAWAYTVDSIRDPNARDDLVELWSALVGQMRGIQR